MMALRSHHYENIDILQPPSEENLPQPGVAGPRVPRPNAAVLPAPQSNMLRAVCSEQSEENRKRSARACPPDGTAVSRLKASVLRPPRANRTATASICSVLRPKGGVTVKESLTEAIRRDRSKSEQSVCTHTQTNRKLLLAVMPHDGQPSFNEQLEIAN